MENKILLNERYVKQFKENYEGRSPEAKEIENFLKETYKGNAYIPWATMERLMIMQDPESNPQPILNREGGLVHTDAQLNEQQNIQKSEVVSHTVSTMLAHFVKVGVKFMGVYKEEIYPIQDKDYSAIKVYDQNLVNKALQRAKAKLGARISGLGLSLYEGKDLQFEEDEVKPSVKPAPKAKAAKTKITKTKTAKEMVEEVDKVAKNLEIKPVEKVEPKAAPKPVEAKADSDQRKGIEELVDFVLKSDKEKIVKAIQPINKVLLLKYKFALSPDSDRTEMIDNLLKVPKIDPVVLLGNFKKGM